MGKGTAPAPYRQALEAIGWYFDRQHHRGIFVAEVDEGYVGKARPAGQETEMYGEGFHFPHADVAELIQAAAAGGSVYDDPPPLCPGGYSTFLAAVGEMYDRSGAGDVSVLEVLNGFVIAYTAPTKDGRKVERRRRLLDRAGIEDLLNRVNV